MVAVKCLSFANRCTRHLLSVSCTTIVSIVWSRVLDAVEKEASVMSPTVDKASCNENKGDSLLNPGHRRDSVVLWLPDWNSAVLMPLWRALSTDLELVVLKKSPKTQSECMQKGKRSTFLQGKCWNSMPGYTISISSLFELYSRIQKRFGLKKTHPSSNNGYNHTFERKN